MCAKILKLFFSPAVTAAKEAGLLTEERCISLTYSFLSGLTHSQTLLLSTAGIKELRGIEMW